MAWHICTESWTNDDTTLICTVITTAATVAIAWFAWRGFIIERQKNVKGTTLLISFLNSLKTLSNKELRTPAVATTANNDIQSLATLYNIPQGDGLPKIRVEGGTMYIDTKGE